MNIINLTPHAIHFMNEVGETVLTVPPSGTVARAEEQKENIGVIDTGIEHSIVGVVKIPVNRKKYGNISGLPDPQPDTIYIVSVLVAQAVPDREDVFIPDDIVRDEQGRIIGCRALARV